MNDVCDWECNTSRSSMGEVSTHALPTPMPRPSAATPMSSTTKKSIFTVVMATESMKLFSRSRGRKRE